MPTIRIPRISSSSLYKIEDTRDLKGTGWNEPLQEYLPGAIKVALLFSAANINTVKTSSAVKNISMKTPWAMDVPCVRVVVNAGVPGNMHRTRAAACGSHSQHDCLRDKNMIMECSRGISAHSVRRIGPITHHHPSKHLCWEEKRTPKRWESSCDAIYCFNGLAALFWVKLGEPKSWISILHHSKCHSRIEQSTAYSIENPSSDSERKAKAKADEKELVDCGRSIGVYRV